MSRRYVHTSKFNDLNEVVPEIVAVVSAKDNLQTLNDEQKYFKRNYIEAIRKIIPKFYFSDEQAISGTHVTYTNQLINSHIFANKHQATILPVSSLIYDTYLSSINTPGGFASYFYKNRSPAQISPDDFQRNFLFPRGKKLTDFTTSTAFVDYLSGSFLPSIPMVCTGHHATDDLAALTASAYANDSSGTYKYLANNLGWLYFLNRTGPAAAGGITPFDPSTAIPTLLVETVWKGRSIVLQDNLEVYQEYLWKNQPIWGLTDKVIPADYVSSMEMSAGTWTSGTQNIDRLKTLVSIVYSPHFLDSPDNKVENAFTTYINTSSISLEGTLITDREEAGPLKRFLDGMSFAIADRVTEQAEINTLYDIGKCPEEFLELLGELIGWKYIGGDIDKWRVQLRNAVDIYKMKGTRRSVQYLLDTLFSTGVFNVTTSDTLSELWESYVPDLLYYSLATSSPAFKDFATYTPALAQQFGITSYNSKNMATNIKLVVDKILFDLVREFPDSFFLGGEPFPTPNLLLDGEPYTGPYNIQPPENLDLDSGDGVGAVAGTKKGGTTPTPFNGSTLNPLTPPLFPSFWTGYERTSESVKLILDYDPDFTFYYRDRIFLVPPYEKRQYYTTTQVSKNLLEQIKYYLICYGVDKAFAGQVVNYINSYTADSLDTNAVLNSFLFYTKSKTYPPNYNNILKDVTKERTPDPLSLLSIWNGKSSHFIMNFDSSTFNFDTQRLTSTSRYGLTKVTRVLNEVIPAHAVPLMLLSISSVADSLDAIGDNDCREWRPNFNDLYEGSSTVTTGWATCAVDMAALATDNGLSANRFTRTQVDNLNDVLLSGNTFVAANAAPRNSLRRRGLHNLLPETKMFTRLGRNNPGSLELSTSLAASSGGTIGDGVAWWASGIWYMPLGFIPSALQFRGVDLKANPVNGIGELLQPLPPVWEICENLNSPSSLYGYNISATFPSRGKQNIPSSGCSTYGRRGQMPEILYVMNKTHDIEKFLQASSIVSGYYDDNGEINPDWPTSSVLLTPNDFSGWYGNTLNVVKSMGNHLINKDSADESLTYLESFQFGRPVHELYNTYMTDFSGHGSQNNYDLQGKPNIYSHTFGPLIYNSQMDIDGSALEVSSFLSASSTVYEVDISYNGGIGILSIWGMNGKGYYDLGTSAASDSGDLPLGGPGSDVLNPAAEFRNRNLVSSIELVDTSTATAFTKHPIFSLFRLSRDDQSKYSFNKYLINNQIIKYHRSTSIDSFPRIRIPINNSQPTDLASNFLEPDHEYEISIKAHNLDITSTEIGGLSLGVWIHTAPELDNIWYYAPEGIYDDCGVHLDTWKGMTVANASSAGGLIKVQQAAETKPFTLGDLENVFGTGEGKFVTEDINDLRCFEPQFLGTVINGTNPASVANIGPQSLETITFKFSTKNNDTFNPGPFYKAAYGKVHRKDQKYTIELFVPQGHNDKFVVIEEISIKDVTDYNKAVIRTKYGDAQLDPTDLKAVFKYFKTLSSGIASRNAMNTSGVMEVSGGSRLNYRSNVAMYTKTLSSGYLQLTEIDIIEG